MDVNPQVTLWPLVIACSTAFACLAERPRADLYREVDFYDCRFIPAGPGWTIEDGVIHRQKRGAGNLVSKEVYKDFELTFEWKVARGGNSGVIYRSKNGRGLEYQILDDERHYAGRREDGRAGALYNLAAPDADKPYKPAGQWNTARIVAAGDHIEHWLNGKKIVEIDLTGDDWERRYQQSKYAVLRHKNFGKVESPITLQDHGHPVWYRNFRVRILDAGRD